MRIRESGAQQPAAYARVAMMLGAIAAATLPDAGPAGAQERGLVFAGTLSPGIERAYGYKPVDGRLANVFRDNGRIYSVMLVASHTNGLYLDDKIGIYDITNPSNVLGWTYPIAEVRDRCCNGADISIAYSEGDLRVSVTVNGSSWAWGIAIRDLYRLRAGSAIPRTPCGLSFLSGYQGGDYAAFTYFDPSVAAYLSGPAPANFRILAPRYVVPTSEHFSDGGRRLRGPLPIADTGCWLTFNESDQTWYPTSSP
jgi:hypothetical protein